MALPPMTRTTVGVLTVLLDAWENKRDVGGWQLMKALSRSGPAIYRVLDRLESAGWITGEWERLDPEEPRRARRRYYRLTGVGVAAARAQQTAKQPLPALRPQLGLDMLLGSQL